MGMILSEPTAPKEKLNFDGYKRETLRLHCQEELKISPNKETLQHPIPYRITHTMMTCPFLTHPTPQAPRPWPAAPAHESARHPTSQGASPQKQHPQILAQRAPGLWVRLPKTPMESRVVAGSFKN